MNYKYILLWKSREAVNKIEMCLTLSACERYWWEVACNWLMLINLNHKQLVSQWFLLGFTLYLLTDPKKFYQQSLHLWIWIISNLKACCVITLLLMKGKEGGNMQRKGDAQRFYFVKTCFFISFCKWTPALNKIPGISWLLTREKSFLCSIDYHSWSIYNAVQGGFLDLAAYCMWFHWNTPGFVFVIDMYMVMACVVLTIPNFCVHF